MIHNIIEVLLFTLLIAWLSKINKPVNDSHQQQVQKNTTELRDLKITDFKL